MGGFNGGLLYAAVGFLTDLTSECLMMRVWSSGLKMWGCSSQLCSFFLLVCCHFCLFCLKSDEKRVQQYFFMYFFDSYCDPVEVAAISGNPGDGVVTPVDCPAGYYCPSNTGAKSSFPCAVGTFSNSTQLQSQSQCQSCTGGYFCDTPGEDLDSQTKWLR